MSESHCEPIQSKDEREDLLVGGGVVSAGVTMKEKALEVDVIKKLAEGVYLADTMYAPVASGCCGVKLYVTNPGPVLVTCHASSAFSAQRNRPSCCALINIWKYVMCMVVIACELTPYKSYHAGCHRVNAPLPKFAGHACTCCH